MIKCIHDRDVFHGSSCVVAAPDVQMGENGKDFGKGFYVTTDYRQAVSFSKLKAGRNGSAQGIVNVYRLSDLEGLRVFEFTEVDAQWLNCIVGFRNARYQEFAEPYREYDVIIGKIADDNTSRVINAYMTGAYGPAGSSAAQAFAIQMLLPDKLKNQLCFRTERSLERLTFCRSEEHKR